MNLSKTQRALALIGQGKALEDAAKESGAALSTIRVALWKQKGRQVCPCCGQIVREGFEVKHMAKEPEAVYEVDRLPRLLEMMKADLAKGIDPTTKEWIEDIEKLWTFDS